MQKILDYISSKMIQKPMIGQINYDGLVEQSLDISFDELLKCRIDVYHKVIILSQINKVNTHIYIFNTMVECLSMLQQSADAIYICYISNHNTSDGYFGFFIKNNGNIFSINERVPEAFVGQHQNGRNHRFIENKPEGLFPYELFNIGKYDYLGYATSYTLKNQDNEEISLTNLQDMSYITLLLTILLLKFRFEDKELMEELVYSNFALDCNLQLLQENTKNNAIMTIQDSLAIQNSRNVLTDIVSSLTTKTILEGVYNEQFDSKKHPDLHYRATGEFCNNIFVELYGADFKFDPSVILQEHSLKLLGDSKATINAEFIGTKDELRLQIYQSARQQLATHIQTQMDKDYEQFKKDHIKAKNMFSPIDGSNVRNEYYRLHFSMSESLSKRLNKK